MRLREMSEANTQFSTHETLALFSKALVRNVFCTFYERIFYAFSFSFFFSISLTDVFSICIESKEGKSDEGVSDRRMKSRFIRGEVKVVTRFIRYRDKKERHINVAWQINFQRFKPSVASFSKFRLAENIWSILLEKEERALCLISRFIWSNWSILTRKIYRHFVNILRWYTEVFQLRSEDTRCRSCMFK